MKNFFAKPVLLTVSLVVVYFFSLIIGSLSLCYYTIYSQQKDILFSIANKSAARYLDDKTYSFEEIVTSDMNIVLYDSATEQSQRITPAALISGADAISVEKDLPTVLLGKNVFRTTYWAERVDIIVIAGIPLRDGNDIVGALFLLRNLKIFQRQSQAFLFSSPSFIGSAHALL